MTIINPKPLPNILLQIRTVSSDVNHRRLRGYNAGWFGTGLGSCASNRDTNVHLDLTSWGIDPRYRLVLSETERILPVCNHFGFISKSSGSFLGAARINSRWQISYNSARFIGDTSGNTTQAKHSRQCYNQSITRS